MIAIRKTHRRCMAVALLCALVASSPGAASASRGGGSREQRKSYVLPAPAVDAYGTGMGQAGDCERGLGCVSFDLAKEDRYASFRVIDESGQPILAWVYAFQGDRPNIAEFCERTKKKLTIQGYDHVWVSVRAAPWCGPQVAGEPVVWTAPTTGEVIATFYPR